MIKRLTMLCLAVAAASVCAAEVPNTLDYQGYLTDASGAPVTGPTSIDFALYRSASGGTPVWSHGATIDVDQGLFSVVLGSSGPALPATLADGPLFLGIAINGDGELSPRRALRASAYALRAASANALGGASLDDVLSYASAGRIPAGARVPVVDVVIPNLTVDAAAIGLTLDGRSFAVRYTQSGLAQWAPLAIEYRYPVGSPPPLGVTAGTLAFASVELYLADDPNGVVVLQGQSVAATDVVSRIVTDGAGGAIVHNRVELSGMFDFVAQFAPPWTGPLAVTLADTSSDAFAVSARGALQVALPASPGPGPGGQPLYQLELLGFGPAEFALLVQDYAISNLIAVELRLDGTSVPGARDCKLDTISGLAPFTLDDNGTPRNSVRFERAGFECTREGAAP